jgi:hypothetical protein
MADGAGNHYCLDTGSTDIGLCPVVFWDHERRDNQVPDLVSESFTKFLDEQLRSLGTP